MALITTRELGAYRTRSTCDVCGWTIAVGDAVMRRSPEMAALALTSHPVGCTAEPGSLTPEPDQGAPPCEGTDAT